MLIFISFHIKLIFHDIFLKSASKNVPGKTAFICLPVVTNFIPDSS